MIKERVFYIFLIGLMCICLASCGGKELHSEGVSNMEQNVKQTNELTLYGENDYKLLLMKATSETLVEMIVDDFDGDGQNEAFAITANPDSYARYLENPENAEACMESSLWYMSGTRYENIYLDDMDAFIYLEQGILNDKTKYIKVQDWYSHIETTDSYYTVEDGQYKLLFELSSSLVNEDGTIVSYYYIPLESGWDEGKRIYVYENGELKLVEESIGKLGE